MTTVQLAEQERIVLPKSLGLVLGLHEGDRVQVWRQDQILWFRRNRAWSDAPGPLTDLARIVSSSRPEGSVDIEPYLSKHGYEQIDERPGF